MSRVVLGVALLAALALALPAAAQGTCPTCGKSLPAAGAPSDSSAVVTYTPVYYYPYSWGSWYYPYYGYSSYPYYWGWSWYWPCWGYSRYYNGYGYSSPYYGYSYWPYYYGYYWYW